MMGVLQVDTVCGTDDIVVRGSEDLAPASYEGVTQVSTINRLRAWNTRPALDPEPSVVIVIVHY